MTDLLDQLTATAAAIVAKEAELAELRAKRERLIGAAIAARLQAAAIIDRSGVGSARYYQLRKDAIANGKVS